MRFTGVGGTYIAIGTQAAAPRPAFDESLVFQVIEDGTIPNPGVPDPPEAEDAETSGDLDGTYEYAVTFVTDGGETEASELSDPVTVSSSKIDLVLPLGGDGTIARRIYRVDDGGPLLFLDEVADNTTENYQDNLTATGPSAAPTESTAERITLEAEGVGTGVEYNAAANTIIAIVDSDSGINAVTNPSTFTGGEDEEDIEEFRVALLARVRAPGTGGRLDLIDWATSIPGVETASVFKNVDLAGDPAPGTVVVRIAGPDGAIPDPDVVQQVQDYLDDQDLANITILVGTFTPFPVDVTVDVTLAEGFVLSDVQPSIEQAVTDYIDSVPVGGTVYVAGIYWAVFSLPAVETLSVADPSGDVPTNDDEKAVVGTITVSEVT